MADNQTQVVYKAIADFSALSKAARKAKRDLQDLKKEEKALNDASVAGSTASTIAAGKSKKGREALVKQFEAEAGATQKATASVLENAAATRQQANATKASTDATNDLSDAVSKVAVEHTKWKKDASGVMQVIERNGKAVRSQTRELNATQRAMANVMGGAGRLDKALTKLGNWRPRLLPPFIALIPIIGGVLALINPLVAGLGGVGAAALGFASNLGRVASGAIGAIPALTTLMSVVAALKTSFGGIGNAFKAFGAMKDAAAGGGGGAAPARAELTRTEEITRAQEDYARSLQDVAWAQEDLDEARKGYIKRLTELQKAVDRASMSEARAAANSQLARENYANVLADPGSTKGAKMDAKTGVDEAQADYSDTISENKQNAADLAKMQRDGIAMDREVIRAQRALTDAIRSQRDAQLELANAQSGANSASAGAVTAVDEYAAALAKLSPSARRFVENLVSMNDAWTTLKKNVQEQFFKNVADDILLLRNIFPALEYLLGRSADALGRLTSNFIKLVTSPEWQKDLMIIGDQNVPIIETVGRALLAWVGAFKDLSIIAGPFLAALTTGLAEGAENFERIVGRTRETGELAAYLEKVRDAMSQWWRILKNVGMTLFNYSAAAGKFGEWLTDGLEKLTQDWRAASEAARQEGSPFQAYLENLKPLLLETRGLFGDFFSWLQQTMMDPENIRIWTEMVQILREDLGPAISRILDILTKSEVGEGLLKAISSIVQAISTFLENGGIDGFKAFYETVAILFETLNGALSAIPKPVLQLLTTTFATLAALRFFGLTKVLGLLLTLGKGGTLKKLGGLFAGLGGGGLLSGGAAAAGSAGAAAVGGIVSPGMKRSEYRTMTGQGGAAAGKSGFNLLGSIGKGAGKGLGVGAIASIAGTVVGDLISSNSAAGAAGSGQRVGGNAVAGAASGAGLGALIGSIVPGLGTAIGAALGGLIGGGVGLATSSPEDLEAMVTEWGHFFEDIGGWIGEVSAGFGSWLSDVWNGFNTWLTVDLPGWLAEVGVGFYNWLTIDIPTWLGTVVTGFSNWLLVDLPYQLGVLAGNFFNWLTIDMPAWLASVWNGFMTWLTVDMPAWLASVWTGFMNWLTIDMPAWLASVWNGFMRWLTVDMPGWVASVARGFWNWLTVELPNGIRTAADAFWNWLTVELPGGIRTAADSFWNWLTVEIPEAIGKAAEEFWKFIEQIPKHIGDAISSFFGNFGAGFASTQSDGKGDVPGGHAGPTARKIQALMPGGMRISSGYRDQEENRRAGGSSSSLHMDRSNPAVDIVGSKSQMDTFATMLGKIGGWRQLYYNGVKAPGVSYWPDHWDHIHVANQGGKVPGQGNGDSVPSMLTPGEYVIKKSIVSRIGEDNLARLNSGVLSYAQMLQAAQKNKQEKNGTGGGFGGAQMFSAGGLVPDFGGFGGASLPPGAPGDFGGAPGTGGGMSFGDIHVHNPVPETASDSLPRTIRKVAYLGGEK